MKQRFNDHLNKVSHTKGLAMILALIMALACAMPAGVFALPALWLVLLLTSLLGIAGAAIARRR